LVVILPSDVKAQEAKSTVCAMPKKGKNKNKSRVFIMLNVFYQIVMLA
jgi:hypothetical protein